MLEVTGLTTRYGAISALRRVSITVGANEVVGLIGPNGAGMAVIFGVMSPSWEPLARRRDRTPPRDAGRS